MSGVSQEGPVKLLYVITRLDKGGSAEVVLQLASALQGQRFSIAVAYGPTIDPQEDLAAFQERTGVPFHFVSHLRRSVSPLRDLLALLQLYCLLRREKPALLHTHTSKAGFIGRMAGFLARVPRIVHTPHGHVFYGYFGTAWSRLFVWLERLAAPWTDRIITLTEVGKTEHLRFRIAPAEKFVPIYCGIDLSRFQKPSLERVERLKREYSPEGKAVVGSVGRLVPIKGYDTFIQACALVNKTHPETRFLLAGDGPLMEELKSLSRRLGLHGAFFWLGDRSDIPEILALLDLFVLSSLNEGLGRVLMEAAAAGVPAVATHVGGVPEIVREGETGLLVPSGDPEKMAEAIRTLLDNPSTRKRMGEEARRRSGELFGIETMVAKTRSLYESLLEGTP